MLINNLYVRNFLYCFYRSCVRARHQLLIASIQEDVFAKIRQSGESDGGKLLFFHVIQEIHTALEK
ncbi:MAG: hypothetical protein ACH350_07430 [Parachlamydiaceae bacterium]